MEPEFVPQYNKPDEPGISMNFDNSVSVYYVVSAEETFEQAATAVFSLVRDAESQFPAWMRVLYIDIDGHKDSAGRFDDDFVEFQQELLFSTLAPFVTAVETPMTGGLVNPEPQRNDLPDELVIEDPGAEPNLN